MISFGKSEVRDFHGMRYECSLVLKNGVPVLLPVSSYVAGKISIRYRDGLPPGADTERVHLIVHDTRVLSVLEEVDKVMRLHFKNASAYQQLLVRDNSIITRKEHALLARDERLCMELFSTHATCKPRLQVVDVGPYAEKISLARQLNLLPELQGVIAQVLLRLFWI